MSRIAIVGEFTTKPGAFESFYPLMVANARASREEPGNLRFDVMVPHGGENRLLIYQIYQDQSALAAHGATERVKTFRDKVQPLLESRNFHICTLQDSGDA